MLSLPGRLWVRIGSLDMPGLRGKEIAEKVAKDASVKEFVGPEPTLGARRKNIRTNIKRCFANQHW